MVGIFAGLKWRLVSSRFRLASSTLKLWYVLGWCAAVLVLGLAVVGLALLRSQPDVAAPAIAFLFTVQMVSWVLAPLVAFGIDETVDPTRFALLPLSTSTLQRGLLVSSIIGYLPVANAVLLVGAAIALSSSWVLFPAALVCSAAQLLLCVVVSRAASAAMSGLMSGRRGRDLGMLIGSGIFVLYLVLSFALNRASATGGSDRKTAFGDGALSVARILSWGPNGALAGIPGWLHDGRTWRLVFGLATAVVAIGLGWYWWNRALARSLTTSPSTSEGSAPAGQAERSNTVANSLSSMVRLIVARDRLLTWRDPMRRIPWLMVAALGVLWPLLVIRGHGSVYGVAFAAVMVGMQASNQFGVEGSGIWLHMVAFADRERARGEALGHSLFAVLPGSMVVVASIFVQAFIRHDLALVPAATGVCLAVMAGSVAFGGYTSARLPYAVRQSRKSMFANSIPGQKGRTLGSTLASLGGGVVVALPAVVLAVLNAAVSPVFGWAALVVGPLCGAAAIWVVSGRTATAYLTRMPEILATVTVGDRS